MVLILRTGVNIVISRQLDTYYHAEIITHWFLVITYLRYFVIFDQVSVLDWLASSEPAMLCVHVSTIGTSTLCKEGKTLPILEEYNIQLDCAAQ